MQTLDAAPALSAARELDQDLSRAADASARLVAWLVEDALPLWSTVGVDLRDGGFFEKIGLDGKPVEEPRRARVVARQIFVFATAARRGWLPLADQLVEHGLDFLLGKMRLRDGTFAAAIGPQGEVVQGSFDLYEHAFILFAMAAACRARPARSYLRKEAEALLQHMRRGWAHPHSCFEESSPRSLPLKSNPHMHLLEAALAWAEISDGEEKRVWTLLADEIVERCLASFIGHQGEVREYFDGDWQPMPGEMGRVVEPGHQFEWAWLLMRWSQQAGSAAAGSAQATGAAQRLIDIGERFGVSASHGAAVDRLGGDLRIADRAAKLWPQTERVKALHAASTSAQDAAAPRRLNTPMEAALKTFYLYIADAPAGLWRERMDSTGLFVREDCKASSLYHIVCAIDTIADRTPRRDGRSP